MDYGGFGGKAEIVEDARLEDAPGPGCGCNRIQLTRESAIGPHHFGNRGPRRPAANKRVADFPHDAFHRAVMDVRIAAVQVAQRLLNSSLLGFKDKPTVPARVELGPGHGQAKLKRHIEAWGAMRISIQLNAGEIVNRISATLYQLQDSIQSALASGNSEGSARFNQAESSRRCTQDKGGESLRRRGYSRIQHLG